MTRYFNALRLRHEISLSAIIDKDMVGFTLS